MIELREMTIEDYDQMYELWQRSEGVHVSQADSRDSIAGYLRRNPGLSFVGESGGRVVGTILCGHDGRRGFIYHMAVDPDYRHQQLGQRLAEASLNGLSAQGIDKCHIFVIDDNASGNGFWQAVGWEKRSGFSVYSKSC
ncbi:GNAT family N-acetyltransferase [Paenibacillus tengchongensis]|uniref:GNAT family N-acetyltransferase n=1 Tax=Paenibacillus tengchongensis TaxID=2608684 RepID=UPI00124C42A8|nr:GNAT family N-acetyltransferase [Paenibacillus tengchongensis]